MNPTTRPRPIQGARVRPSAGPRRSAERPLLTADGHFLMQLRAQHLLEVAIPEARTGLDKRRRDPRDVTRLERLCVEAVWLERLLARAVTLPAPSGDVVELGSYVRISLVDGEGTWVRPVPAIEAMLDDHRVSASSPLGAALLGARAGDTVVVDGPAGPWECTILEIAPRDPETLHLVA